MGKKLKKIITSIFIMIITATSVSAQQNVFSQFKPEDHEQVFETSKYKINAIDPTIANNWAASMYPGLRGANQLVIYTSKYGTSTGTNEFGGEAIVENNNIVTSLSGADSLIPIDGIVISAHGRAKTWLNKNIHVGTKVSIDRENMYLNVYTTSDSYIFAAKEKIEEATTMMNYYMRNSSSYNAKPTKESIAKAKNYLRKAERNKSEVKEFATLAMQNANEALAAAIPFKENELKGVWLRPTNTTEEGIIATLNRLQSMGINNVFLETYYHGMTIFPSKTMESYGFIEQNPAFAGIDPLEIWIEEAHKRKIKINIWFESFYIGNKPQVGKKILAVHPEWSNVNFKNIDVEGPIVSTSEHNGYFLDPANPAVQTFLTSLVKEIISNYKVDGFNFDYARYPQSVSPKYPGYVPSNWGYTKYAREEFKLIYGQDPAFVSYNTKLWHEWDNYRRDKVSLFMESVSKICRSNKVKITAVAFPNKSAALETKQQDWTTWSDNNFVDGLTPLFMTCDSKTIKVMIFDMLKEMSPRTKLYAGLFVTFMGGSEEDLIRLIHETRKMNLGGVILFDYAHLQDKYLKTLSKRVFLNICDNNSKEIKVNYKR